MIRNYIVIALRNLSRQKFYSFINIFGLTVGIACFLMIILYVVDELSYDKHIPDRENIYRLDFEGVINGSSFITNLSSVPAAQAMVNDYPEVLEAVRIRERGEVLVRWNENEQVFKETKMVFADSNFLSFFKIPLLQGAIATALQEPNKVVISKKSAQKYFGDTDPIGKILVVNTSTNYEVTGVYEDMPRNQHFNFDMVYSMNSIDESKQKFWMSFNFVTYLKLAPGASAAALEAKFPAMIEKYIGPEVEKFMGMDLNSFVASGNKAGFTLFPLVDIHLHSNKLGELAANGDIKYVYLFSAIAFFILLIACINFMNLATARSASRAKEVGVRKVMGAYRSSLIRQFLVEAIVICVFSFFLAYAICFILLPSFNELSGKSLTYNDILQPQFLGILVALMLVVGAIAGSYPAFYLSSFKPAEVLKGKVKASLSSGAIRSGLVVFQFTLSIMMMVGTAVIYDQMNYIQNKKLGYDKDHVIMVHDAWLMRDKLPAFKNEVVQHADILNGTITSYLPVNTNSNNSLFFAGQNADGPSYIISNWTIDMDYIPTLGIEVVQGRNFSKEFPTDSTAVIINETAAQKLGFSEPIGQYISTYDGGTDDNPNVVSYKVIGVIKDFHFQSLRDNIEPMLLYMGRSRGYISFKLAANGASMQDKIDFIKSKWEEMAPGQPFDYSFMDQRFNAMYDAEQRVSGIITVFAVFAILIACLGLFGLASFTTEQRTKEIGIRKVLGASVGGIMTLLTKNFIKLICISFIIAAPLSYLLMGEWLDNFAYRTSLNITTFLAAGLLALLIAWLTMSYQTLQAARSNPVKSLRSE